MAKTKGAGTGDDSKLDAVQEVYRALRDLKEDERISVLNAATALLAMSSSLAIQAGGSVSITPGTGTLQIGAPQLGAAKKLSIIELLGDKNPKTNPERIALFAYYREHIENLPQFERDDLRPYFTKARLAPPTNFDRDFGVAVSKGWIHEEGADSYLTNSGSQVVEAGFSSAGARPRRAGSKPRKAPVKKPKANRGGASRRRGRR